MVYLDAWSQYLAKEPFEDEIHPRLRYAHRGLVAMANNGTKNSNDSQFFITLGEKHLNETWELKILTSLLWHRQSG